MIDDASVAMVLCLRAFVYLMDCMRHRFNLVVIIFPVMRGGENYMSTPKLQVVEKKDSILNVMGEKSYLIYQRSLEAERNGESQEHIGVMLKPVFIKMAKIYRQGIKEALTLRARISHGRSRAWSILEAAKTDSEAAVARVEVDWWDAELDQVRNGLAAYGENLINLVLPALERIGVTPKEFARLIRVKPRAMAKALKELTDREHEAKNERLYFDLIFLARVEPDKDCPFFQAIFAAMLDAMDKNPKLKRAMDNKLDELFPELFTAGPRYVTQDEFGRVKSVQCKPGLVYDGTKK